MAIPKKILKKLKRWCKAQKTAVLLQKDIEQWCLENKIVLKHPIPHGLGWYITPEAVMNRQIKEIEEELSAKCVSDDNANNDNSDVVHKLLVMSNLSSSDKCKLDRISALNYDVCVLLGDISSDVVMRIRELVTKPIYAVGGNHDTRSMYIDVDIPYINGQCVEVNGLTIVGIEGCNRYKKSNNFIMLSQEESLMIAELLPPADILISHDSCYERYGTAPNKRGLKGISCYIEKNKPKLHLHGHYHIYDKYEVGDTLCLACYGCMLVDTDGNAEKVF